MDYAQVQRLGELYNKQIECIWNDDGFPFQFG